jgi:beta-lactamase class A
MAARTSVHRLRFLLGVAVLAAATLATSAAQARPRRHVRYALSAQADSIARAESLLAPLGTQGLEAQVARLADAAGGTVGVAVVHVETGERVSLRGTERFPMASVFKLPIAMQVLHRVDQGDGRGSSPGTHAARTALPPPQAGCDGG